MVFVFFRLVLYSFINVIRNLVNFCASSFWVNFIMFDWLMSSCFVICREETDCSLFTLVCRKLAIFCSFSVNLFFVLFIFVRYNIFYFFGLVV